MNENLKRILDEIEGMSKAQKEFKSAQIEERMSRYNIDKCKMAAGVARLTLEQLKVEQSVQNAAILYPMLMVLMDFKELHDARDPEFMELLSKL